MIEACQQREMTEGAQNVLSLRPKGRFFFFFFFSLLITFRPTKKYAIRHTAVGHFLAGGGGWQLSI